MTEPACADTPMLDHSTPGRVLARPIAYCVALNSSMVPPTVTVYSMEAAGGVGAAAEAREMDGCE